MSAPLRLVVIADSTAFTDHTGPQLPDHKALYPNVLAAGLERALVRPVHLHVLARAGMDVREAWKLVFKDRHAMFEMLMGADAVVVGVGSIDHAPTGTPAVLEAVIPYLRSARARRRARAQLRRAHGALVRLTRARMTRTPTSEFARLYDAVLHQTRSLAHGAAGVALGPTSHFTSYYGTGHPQYRARDALQRDIAGRHGFAYVGSWPVVEPYASGLNPDGIHWPHEAHQAVGDALVAALIPQMRGSAPRLRMPGSQGHS